jgi:hypothetical protein
MCDYSLTGVKSRPARAADKLITCDFGAGTRGFCAAEDPQTAVCVQPGTELRFAAGIKVLSIGLFPWRERAIGHRMAIFRQINKGKAAAHHDALEFPDGKIMLLTLLREGQEAAVLQLPVQPNTTEERRQQERVAYTG